MNTTTHLKSKKVSESQVIMTEMVLPQHTNSLDTVFGGVIMSWIDICAAICAQRHTNKSVVTASIDALHFVAPVKKGWIVNLKASVNFVSKTSMEIGVRVDAENPISNENFHTATAYLTFVALDSRNKPTPVVGLEPETDAEMRRYKAAQVRRQARLETKKQLLQSV